MKTIFFSSKTRRFEPWKEDPDDHPLGNFLGLYRYHLRGLKLKQNGKIIRVDSEDVDSIVRWLAEP